MASTLAKPPVVVATILLTSAAWCEEKRTTDLSKVPTGQLIEQLASPSFETRDLSTKELARRGDSISSDLEGALRHADLEIRLRARELLARMSHADLQRRLNAFIEDVEGRQEHDLPGWKEYEALVGGDKANRKLFADMVSEEIDLLRTYQSDKKRVAAMLSGRIEAFENGLIPGLPQQASPASVATLLFLASDDRVPLNTTLGYQVYRFLNQSASRQAIEQGEHSPLVKELLVVWIERGMSNSSLARNGLLLAERYELNETALSLARTLIGKEDAASYTLPYALLTIGRFGGEDDVQLVQTLLDNKSVCHTWHNGKFERPIQVQVRDVALAVLIHLTKQDHKSYGYDLLRPDPKGMYYVYTMGFPDDAKRDKALAKWHQWSAKQAG